MSLYDAGMLGLVLLLGVTSLYGLLGLFQRMLPTREALEAGKLARVGTVPNLDRGAGRIDVVREWSMAAGDESRPRIRDSRVPLSKMLKFAAWRLSPTAFYGLSAALSLFLLIALYAHVDAFMLPLALFAGPIVMRNLLRRSIERRANRFGDDYPQFLMTTVGLLKTGMTPFGALEAAALGLEHKSLVRHEVLLMLERVRIGIPEDTSMGSFGETIQHPEIELFVQSLLLGLRVGGSLADSLERLSKQVRKRQYFKSSAVASVAQQRGSMIAILVIMGGLALFIVILMPKLMIATWYHPTGWRVIQACIAAVLVATMWLQAITRLKI